jgi:hypothetical protein
MPAHARRLLILIAAVCAPISLGSAETNAGLTRRRACRGRLAIREPDRAGAPRMTANGCVPAYAAAVAARMTSRTRMTGRAAQ